MEMKSPAACPNTVTVRRNPSRRARATPSSHIPMPLPLSSSTPSSTSKDIPSFPIEDILSIQVPQNPSNKPEEPIPAENLRVFLRIKPLSTTTTNQTLEKTSLSRNRKNVWPQNPNAKHNNNASKTKHKKKAEVCLQKNDSHSVTLCPPLNLQEQKRNKSEVYEGFSFVFSADSSQDEVYEKMVDPLVDDFLRGKSGMLAALGPSGSGKTHTIFGTARQPGMIPLALRRIFSGNEGSGAQPSRTFYLSMFEICSERGKSERILDLCRDGSDVCIQQSNIKGLHESIVRNVQQAESLIAMGMVKRSTATTNSNNQSSRSQCIINIRCDTDDNAGALLTIVDLAGAEREKRTGNQGARLLESNFINNTSMVFGLCLRSLLEHQKNRKKPLQKHFQNSLLTRYLREYLEGKKRMALVLTIKSGEEDYVDASFLLRQASPYMKIKFSNSEEPSDAIGNKRLFQMSMKLDQVKRLKVNEGKINGTSTAFDKDDHSKESTKSEVYEDTSCNELLNRDRQNQIMISFAKATWKVLKQYKEKLKVAEKEICCLKEDLILEKTRSSELEVELNHFKSCYSSCENKVEGGASSVNLNGCEFTENLQNSNPPVSCSGVSNNSCIDVKIFETQSYQVNRRSDDLEDLTGIEISSSSVEGCKFQGEAKEAAETSSFVNLNGSDFIESLQNSDPAGSRPAVVNEIMRSEDLEDPTAIQISSCLEGDQFQCEADEVAEASSVNMNASDFIENMQISNPSMSCSSVVSNSCIDVENFKEHSYLEDPKRRGNSSSPVERDHLQCVVDEKLLDQPRRSKEDLKRTNLCKVDDASEVAIRPVSCPEPQITAEKPKRRLQPASSILLKSISGLGIEEENEKPKGTRGDRKIGLDVTKRTQGSMSLLRLLKDNL